MRLRVRLWGGVMGWDYVSELQLPTGLLFIPQVINEHGEQWGRLGKTPDSSTWALWQSYQQNHLVANRKDLGEGNGFWLRNITFILVVFFTCRKILQYRASGFTSRPKEGELRIVIALKNPLPRPGSNSRNLGPMTSTLAITPPKR
jgi:hypothetical protein